MYGLRVLGAQVETCQYIFNNNDRILTMFSLQMLHVCALRWM